MLRILVVVLASLPAAVLADSYKCESIKWGTDQEKLGGILTKKSAEGWQLVSFPKPSMACYVQQNASTTYECLRINWKTPEDLMGELTGNAHVQPIAFPYPGTLCGRRTGAARTETSKKSLPEPPDSSAGAPTPAPTAPVAEKAKPAKATGEAPKGDVRERAARLHAELKILEDKYAAGSITKEEYEAKKAELEAQ